MKFPNLNSAKDYSRTHEQMIYVELFGQVGVFQIYPGGRTIQWPANERYWRRLTPDAEFKTPYSSKEYCLRCGLALDLYPYPRHINQICMTCHREAGTTWGLLDSLSEESK
jgi:hypothetical protein